MRAKICEGLNYLGIEIDAKRNNIREEALISSDGENKGLSYSTNEELMLLILMKSLTRKIEINFYNLYLSIRIFNVE